MTDSVPTVEEVMALADAMAQEFVGPYSSKYFNAHHALREAVTRLAASPADPIRELLAKHEELIEEGNNYAYFELAYTRQTGWMAWLTDRPAKGEPGTAEYARSRKVIARGQGDTPDEACTDALSALAPSSTASARGE